MIGHLNSAAAEKSRLRCKITVILYVIIVILAPGVSAADLPAGRVPYTIVDTARITCCNNSIEIGFPEAETEFFGQDAHYIGNEPAYKQNCDGTLTDKGTALIRMKVDSSLLSAGKNNDGRLNRRARRCALPLL